MTDPMDVIAQYSAGSSVCPLALRIALGPIVPVAYSVEQPFETQASGRVQDGNRVNERTAVYQQRTETIADFTKIPLRVPAPFCAGALFVDKLTLIIPQD